MKLIFPNPAALNWQNNMMLSKEQQLVLEMANVLEKKISNAMVIVNPVYICYALSIDYFDRTQREKLGKKSIKHAQKGDIIIWENGSSQYEASLKKEELDYDTTLVNIYTIHENVKGRKILFSVYEKK